MPIEILTQAVAYQGSAQEKQRQKKVSGENTKTDSMTAEGKDKKRTEKKIISSQTIQGMEEQPLTQKDQKNGTEILREQQKQREKDMEKLKERLEEMNKKANKETEIVFGVHEKTNRNTIKIIDKMSHKVLKEYPPEEMLDMIAKGWELAGIVMDEKL